MQVEHVSRGEYHILRIVGIHASHPICALSGLSRVIFTAAPRGKYCYYPHLIEEETEEGSTKC